MQWRGGSVRAKAEVWVVVDRLERKWLEKKCGKLRGGLKVLGQD